MNHGLDLGAIQNVVTSGLTGNATEGNSDQLTVLVVRSLPFLFLPLYLRGFFFFSPGLKSTVLLCQ